MLYLKDKSGIKEISQEWLNENNTKLSGEVIPFEKMKIQDKMLIGLASKEDYNSLQSEKRASAYREESDPLFFKVQRCEAVEKEWLDKIAEIKKRYEYK
jgi:hypothetical protein